MINFKLILDVWKIVICTDVAVDEIQIIDYRYYFQYDEEDYAIAGGCNESKEEGNQIDRKLISFIKIIAIH